MNQHSHKCLNGISYYVEPYSLPELQTHDSFQQANFYRETVFLVYILGSFNHDQIWK